MKGIDSFYADDVKAKKEGVKVFIPHLDDQFILISAFDSAKINDKIRKIKHNFYDEVESPTQEEKALCFKAALIEEIIKGWNIYEAGELLEFNEKNLKRIFLDEKYDRLLDFVLSEAQNQENYKLKEIEDAKKK
jgi:hypothetical protein